MTKKSVPISTYRVEMGTRVVQNFVIEMTEKYFPSSEHNEYLGTSVVQNCVVKMTETSVIISVRRTEMDTCVVHNFFVKLTQLDHLPVPLLLDIGMRFSLENILIHNVCKYSRGWKLYILEHPQRQCGSSWIYLFSLCLIR